MQAIAGYENGYEQRFWQFYIGWTADPIHKHLQSQPQEYADFLVLEKTGCANR